MSKYSDELKLEIVEKIFKKLGYEYLLKEYHILYSIRNWCQIYKNFGEQGIEKSYTLPTYFGEFKHSVLKYSQNISPEFQRDGKAL